MNSSSTPEKTLLHSHSVLSANVNKQVALKNKMITPNQKWGEDTCYWENCSLNEKIKCDSRQWITDMWRFTIGVIADWIEEFRLFCMSFWSELYLLRNDLTTENVLGFFLSKVSQFWLAVKRQAFAVQLLLSFLVNYKKSSNNLITRHSISRRGTQGQ